MGVGPAVTVGVDVGVAVEVVGTGVGVTEAVGAGDPVPVNVITGLWLFGSVTVKLRVVSVTTSVTDPAT